MPVQWPRKLHTCFLLVTVLDHGLIKLLHSGTYIRVSGRIAQRHFHDPDFDLLIQSETGIRPHLFIGEDLKELHVKVPGYDHEKAATVMTSEVWTWSKAHGLAGTPFHLSPTGSTSTLIEHAFRCVLTVTRVGLRKYGQGDFGFVVRGFENQCPVRDLYHYLYGYLPACLNLLVFSVCIARTYSHPYSRGSGCQDL